MNIFHRRLAIIELILNLAVTSGLESQDIWKIHDLFSISVYGTTYLFFTSSIASSSSEYLWEELDKKIYYLFYIFLLKCLKNPCNHYLSLFYNIETSFFISQSKIRPELSIFLSVPTENEFVTLALNMVTDTLPIKVPGAST